MWSFRYNISNVLLDWNAYSFMYCNIFYVKIYCMVSFSGPFEMKIWSVASVADVEQWLIQCRLFIILTNVFRKVCLAVTWSSPVFAISDACTGSWKTLSTTEGIHSQISSNSNIPFHSFNNLTNIYSIFHHFHQKTLAWTHNWTWLHKKNLDKECPQLYSYSNSNTEMYSS